MTTNSCKSQAKMQEYLSKLAKDLAYTDEEIAGAQKAVEGKTELQALIAYLQSLGHALK